MIITKVVGGLGNQMFQYAAGRALALRYGVSLFIDHRTFKSNYTLRNYGLGSFQINAQDAPIELISMVPKHGRWSRMFHNFFQKNGIDVYREKSFYYDKGFETLGSSTYIEGYWQSERYFKGVSQQIREDFRFIKLPSDLNSRWLDKIKSTVSVSLHVRRGDYISNPAANRTHGSCSLAYYAEAIKKICELVKEPLEFFVFSDDSAWVREHLKFGSNKHHFLEHNDALNCHEDLRLMASCKHHIIANSTFSWWGAWLNAQADKIVIVPAQWFRDKSMCDKDLIPDGWLRI